MNPQLHDPIKDIKWRLFPHGDITQWFAQNPALYARMGLKGHNGIDIVRRHGEHLFAVENGIVVEVKDTPEGFGRHIRIVNTARTREWTYGHMHNIAVKLHQHVKGGQFVGTMGNTGFVVSGNTPFWGNNPYAGTHLHLGLRYIEEGGWSYNPGGPKIDVLNYGNGYRGAVDFLALYRNPKSTSYKIERLAEVRNSGTLAQFADLLIGLGY